MPGDVAIAHCGVDVVLGTIVKCRVDGDIGAAAMRVVKERMIGRCHGGLCSYANNVSTVPGFPSASGPRYPTF
jgi:hypothetical protein